jgi:hypothetical protein
MEKKMTKEIQKLSNEINAMKEKLHSTSWDACPNSLTTRNFIESINSKRIKLIKLQKQIG